MQQSTIFEAIAERDRAFSRIESAESYDDWKPIAEAFVVQFAHEHRGEEFTAEDVTDQFIARGLLRPGDWRWFGPIIRAAAGRGTIVKLEGRGAPRRKGNLTMGASVYVTGRA